MRIAAYSMAGELLELTICRDSVTDVFQTMMEEISRWCCTPALCLEVSCNGIVVRSSDELTSHHESPEEEVTIMVVRTLEKLRVVFEVECNDEAKGEALETLSILIQQSKDREAALTSAIELLHYATMALTSSKQKVYALGLLLKLAQKGNSSAEEALMQHVGPQAKLHHEVLQALELNGEKGTELSKSIALAGLSNHAGMMPAARVIAIRCMSKLAPGLEAISAVLPLLEHHGFVRLAARQALLDMNAYNELLNHCAVCEERFRRCVVQKLAGGFVRSGAEEAQKFQAILLAMNSKSGLIRLTGLQALTRRKPLPSCLEDVQRILWTCLSDSDWEVRCEAVEALARLAKWVDVGHEEILEAAIACLRDRDREVAHAAAQTVFKLASDNHWRRIVATTGFLQMGGIALMACLESAPGTDHYNRIRKKKWRRPRRSMRQGSIHTEALSGCNSFDCDMRHTAIHALAVSSKAPRDCSRCGHQSFKRHGRRSAAAYARKELLEM